MLAEVYTKILAGLGGTTNSANANVHPLSNVASNTFPQPPLSDRSNSQNIELIHKIDAKLKVGDVLVNVR